jgi:hypothetical protein
MSNNNLNTNTSGGIGFCELLTIVFITLKLLGKITWSWWWVLSPIWISIAIVVLVLLVIGIVVLVKSK